MSQDESPASARSTLVRRIVVLATRLEEPLIGRRLEAMAWAGVTVLASPLVGAILGLPWLYTLSSFALLLVLATLAIARLDFLWDEEGAPIANPVQVSFDRLLFGIGFAAGFGWGAAEARRYRTLGRLLLGTCLACAALIAILREASIEFPLWIEQAAVLLSLAGFILVGVDRKRARERALRDGLILSPRSVGAEEAAILSLPATIDCADVQRALKEADAAKHALVREILRAAAHWRPRAREGNERDFQKQFHSLIKTAIPDVDVVPEMPFQESARKVRFDLVIHSGHPPRKRSIVIEMKAHLSSTSEFKRMKIQAQTYLQLWKGRGPLILCLCRTPAKEHARIAAAVEELRKTGPIVAIFAAP